MENIYGVVLYVQRPHSDSCTYSMNYSWLTKPCTTEALQATVDGFVEGIPVSDPSHPISIYGTTLCAYANESGFLDRLPRNELAERFLLALGFFVNLGMGLSGNICLCADTERPRKLPQRVVHALQRGLDAAVDEEEQSMTTTSEETATASSASRRSPILKPALKTSDPCLYAIRHAIETKTTDTDDQKGSRKRRRKDKDE